MKKFISNFDLFSAIPTLRVKGEPEVTNLCGGIFSICVFGVFVYVFISSIVSTINLERITAQEMTEMKSPNPEHIKNVTMAIGIQYGNLVQMRNIFEFRAFLVDRSFNYQQLTVTPCTRQMWKEYNDQKYHILNLDTHLCLKKDEIQIWGQNGAADFKSIYFNLSACSNVSSPVTCVSTDDMDYFFNTSMIWGRFMASSLVILDTGINPTSQNPISYSSYEKTIWLLFSQEQQVALQTFLGTYQINTDVSFLPYEQTQVLKGYFVAEATVSTIINTRKNPTYIDGFIFASSMNRVINRQFGKFDDVLSYVGGLYGIVISFLAIFILSYNQYRYELRVGEGAFAFKDGHLARQNDLHFGKYLKYVVYDWVKSMFCIQIGWNDCQAIDEARQQANQQIDVKILLQRISHLEKVMHVFVNPEGETVMYMAESRSIDEVKNRRNIIQYCEKFNSSSQSITITAFEQLEVMASSLSQGGSTELKSLTSLNPLNPNSSIANFQKQESESQEKNSLEIMDQYVQKYIQKFKITQQSFDLDDNNLKAQEQLTEAFYNLDEEHRKKLIKKIPLGILFRLRQYRNKQLKRNQSVELQYREMNRNFNQQQQSNTAVLAPLKFSKRNFKKPISITGTKIDPSV